MFLLMNAAMLLMVHYKAVYDLQLKKQAAE
jgi:hypothetical protein